MHAADTKLRGVGTKVAVAIVKLDRSWTKCIICDTDIPTDIGFALPMYEGRVDYRSCVGFPACEECYEENQRD